MSMHDVERCVRNETTKFSFSIVSWWSKFLFVETLNLNFYSRGEKKFSEALSEKSCTFILITGNLIKLLNAEKGNWNKIQFCTLY